MRKPLALLAGLIFAFGTVTLPAKTIIKIHGFVQGGFDPDRKHITEVQAHLTGPSLEGRETAPFKGHVSFAPVGPNLAHVGFVAPLQRCRLLVEGVWNHENNAVVLRGTVKSSADRVFVGTTWVLVIRAETNEAGYLGLTYIASDGEGGLHFEGTASIIVH